MSLSKFAKKTENENCLEGYFGINETNEGLTLLLGGKALLHFLKKGKSSSGFSERGCQYSHKTQWIKNKVHQKETRTCDGHTYIIDKSFVFSKDVFQYRFKIKENGANHEVTRCTLTRVKND